MFLRRNMSGRSAATRRGEDAPANDQGVMITLRLAGGPFGTDDERRRVLKLEKSITKAVRRVGVGSVDGHGFGDGTAELFLYGPDAEMLFAAVEQLVSDFRPSAGSRALLTFGAEEGAGSRSIALGTDHHPSGP